MKNIHILPTDKPSRLGYLTKKGKEVFRDLRLFDRLMPNILDSENQNIYITSDEEIKEGDWCIDKHNIVYKQESNKIFSEFTGSKKIILTTDQELIKDGVQAIDTEFLEWFVKNSSCESVNVKKGKMKLNDDGEEYGFPDMSLYKIIIPQKEQCTCKVGEPYNNVCCKVHGSIPKEENDYNGKNEILWISNNPQCKQIESCYNSLSKKCICPKEEPKQETLEEFIKKSYLSRLEDCLKVDFEDGVKLGAKWQQERMYSEEDLREAFKCSRTVCNYRREWEETYSDIMTSSKFESFDKWFQQFKKKL